ncbi:MAG: sensor domain-containing diguanylate cyclase [bacterium]
MGRISNSKLKQLDRQLGVLRIISTELKALHVGLDGVLQHALKIIFKDLGYEGASIFLWIKGTHKLKMKKMVYRNEILQGEEEIDLEEGNPLYQLYSRRRTYVYFDRPKPTYYFALQKGQEFIGMLRIDRWEKGRKLNDSDVDLLLTFVEELSGTIFNVRLLQENQENLKMLQASSEISAAIISTLRLEQMLDQVVKSILKNLGFDQVKLYLVDHSRNFLRGYIRGDLRGNISGLSHEIFPLKVGINNLVDIVMGNEESDFLSKYNDIIYYVPLRVKGKTGGLLTVDNLLSQQRITEMEKKTLISFAGQIGIALENSRLFSDIEKLSITDSITHLYVFRYFKQRLVEELLRAERYKNFLSLIILDIDNFKMINDAYGHQVGDTILVEVCKIIMKSIRKIDFPARYGGDELVIFLPHANNDIVRFIAERIYQNIKSCSVEVTKDKDVTVKVSIGVATFPGDAKDAEELIKKSDDALYWAKTHGRDRICFYSEINELKSG